MRPRFACLLLSVWSAIQAGAQEPPLRLRRVVAGLRNPTDIQAPRDGSRRLFFAQQDGLLRLFRDGALLDAPFLDLRAKTRAGGERGLLGLVFPPDFAAKGHFYVNYTDLAGDSVIAGYRIRPDNPDLADATSETVVLTQRQPFANHNAGQLAFGPDGYLYLGFGDGGGARDPQNNAQNPRTWLGKMLRLDTESESRYRVPPDNPFVGRPDILPEIWALGLRNPWRYSFDRETGDLWIADVGQNRAEEINFQPGSSRGGENYGWNIMEGFECLIAGCRPEPNFTPAVHEYGRSEGISVTGGYVYRGALYPNLRGLYIYGDYGSGRIWGLRREDGRWVNRLLLASGKAISTFGEDEAGELYLADHAAGEIFTLEGQPDRDPPPRFVPEAVTNAASGEPGLVPGSLATISGERLAASQGVRLAARLPLPRMLDGVQVLVNGEPAPVLGSAAIDGRAQINFQTPLRAGGAATATVVALRNGVASEPLRVPVLAAQPGVFTLDGATAVVVHHDDNSLTSRERPLRRGEAAYLLATGLGAVTFPPPDGVAAPRDPLSRVVASVGITLGGVACEVLFAGLAPGLAGVYQVNVRIAAAVPSGDQPLVITAGAVRSREVRAPVE